MIRRGPRWFATSRLLASIGGVYTIWFTHRRVTSVEHPFKSIRHLRDSSAPFISSDSWIEVAEQFPDKIEFVDNYEELVALLNQATVRKTYIVASNEDNNVPPSMSIHHTEIIENHPLVRCVFAKNALYQSSRLNLVPLGPKWQYLSHDHYGEDKEANWKSLNQTEIGSQYPRLSELNERKGILVPPMSETSTTRERALAGLRARLSSTEHTLTSDRVTFEENLSLMKRHKFVISPLGNGRDCHRHWEALLVGTVPIIVHDESLEVAMSGLPVWWVHSYEEVNEEQYQTKCLALHEAWKLARVERLYIGWWAKYISHAQCDGSHFDTVQQIL